MKLHVETSGCGNELFLVHGWCLHSGVWDGLLPELEKNYRVTRVDLPGHGRSRAVPMPGTLQTLAQMLFEVAPQNAVWLGWSLGGLACLRAAMDFPVRMRALLLVCTTPRFVAADDWPQAMPLAQLQSLALGLQRDYHHTVQRFLALQVRGDAAAQTALRRLRKILFEYGEPSTADLQRGLSLLIDSDLRAELRCAHLPTLVVMGGYDRLVPVQAGEYLAAAVNGAQYRLLPKAAHAPFLSHPEAFMSALQQFMRNIPVGAPTNRSDQTRWPAPQA